MHLGYCNFLMFASSFVCTHSKLNVMYIQHNGYYSAEQQVLLCSFISASSLWHCSVSFLGRRENILLVKLRETTINIDLQCKTLHAV